MASRAPLEADVQAMIVQTAALLHWRVFHTFDSRKSSAGFPDLTLVRGRVIYAELKREGEKPRADQVAWLDELAAAGAEVYLWRLPDFEEIKEILSGDWTWQGSWHRDRRSRSLQSATRLDWQPGSLWIPTRHGRNDSA